MPVSRRMQARRTAGKTLTATLLKSRGSTRRTGQVTSPIWAIPRFVLTVSDTVAKLSTFIKHTRMGFQETVEELRSKIVLSKSTMMR